MNGWMNQRPRRKHPDQQAASEAVGERIVGRWHEGNIHVVMKSWRLSFRRVGDEVGRAKEGWEGREGFRHLRSQQSNASFCSRKTPPRMQEKED